MILHLGLQFNNRVHPNAPVSGDEHYCDPKGVLTLLERRMGCAGYDDDNAALRIEQYRQALTRHAQTAGSVFYRAAFDADPFATAADLLDRRDELLLAGWTFELSDATPARLRVLAELEPLWQQTANGGPAPGFADRWGQLLDRLRERPHPVERVVLHHPAELYPSHVSALLEVLGQVAAVAPYALPDNAPEDSDLGHWQSCLLGETPAKRAPRGDGSIGILRGASSTAIADYAAQLLRNNADYRPLVLLPAQRRTFDQACRQEGLPSMGLLSASVARPSLQILKLVTTFLWDPIDPKKILEFVSLPLKPLDDRLARVIAREMADRPGIGSSQWRGALGRFWAELDEAAQADATIKVGVVRGDYNRWFERERYPSNGRVPKNEVIELFGYLQTWAYQLYDETSSADHQAMSLMVLSSQARRVKELLMEVPEQQISRLELQRIVRTIYASSPVEQHPGERSHLRHVHAPTAILDPVDELLWWDFVEEEPDFFFSRWYTDERAYLAARQAAPDTPHAQNARLLYQRVQPVLRTRERLLLCIPDQVAGNAVHAHPLFGHLEATFGDLSALTHDLRAQPVAEQFNFIGRSCAYEDVAPHRLAQPTPFLAVDTQFPLPERASESYSSLDQLFYYPHQWALKHHAQLRPSNLLSVVDEKRLKGNLAHKAFERLFREMDGTLWSAAQIRTQLDEQLPGLLRQEGAPLLAYGKEPERVRFVKTLKQAAVKLVRLLRENGWTPVGIEEEVTGSFGPLELKGYLDLVVQRGHEHCIIDLKWSGSGWRRDALANREDLQLAIYAHLLAQRTQDHVHTAYYILDKQQLLVRSGEVFPTEQAVEPDGDALATQREMIDRMLATYRWRHSQLRHGQVEVRTEDTASSLQNFYAEEQVDLFPYLEMKNETNRYDDYRTLVQAFA